MRRQRFGVPKPEVMLSPLVDVVFILLVFIVLVARFVDREEIGIKLPVSAAGTAASASPLAVTLGLDGSVQVGGRDIGEAELEAVLAAARGDHSAAVVIADADVPFQRAVDAITAARLAGFQAVAVATRPPDADP